MQIDVNNFMSKEELKNICECEIRQHLRSESHIERIVSNASYQIVYDLVDSVLDKKLETVLKTKVTNIIEKLTSFNLFHEPDVWSRETNAGYNILISALNDNKKIIEGAVADEIRETTKKALKENLQDYIVQAVQKTLGVRDEEI